MASFTTRVELHNANSVDYTDLHSKMEAQGFSRSIKSDQGATYHLPTAEYDYVGNVTREQVLEKAKAAASKVKSSYAVLVSEATARVWHNLPVKAYA
jgi:hypothetical protein